MGQIVSQILHFHSEHLQSIPGPPLPLAFRVSGPTHSSLLLFSQFMATPHCNMHFIFDG